jgi:peroxiredoxin Q/BCP
MIKETSQAPDFELSDHLGRRVSLSHFRGKRHVLLVFYPLDFTPT